MSSSVSAAIVPWFSRGQYPDLLATMADAAFLPQTHDAWRRGFGERLRTLRQGNVEALVARIDPRAFRIWCEVEELACNAEARLEFAELLAKMAQQDAASPAAMGEDPPRPESSTVTYALRTRIPGWPLLDEAAT